MVAMDSAWLQRIGLILTGLAAISFLPAIVGEARMRSLSDKVRRFRETARNRVTQSLAYSHSSTILFSLGTATLVAAVAVLIFAINSPSPYSYAALFAALLAASILTLFGRALGHIEECRNTADTESVVLLKRRYALFHLVLWGVLMPLCVALSTALRLLAPVESDSEGFEPPRLASMLGSAGIGATGGVVISYLSERLFRKDSSRSLVKIVDFAYKWLITPVFLIPAQATWRGISFIARGSTEVTLGSLLWASRSRNIQFFAFLVFLTGVALQLWSTW